LPSASCDIEELLKIWNYVCYLFIDEISMVHAQLLAQISERIRKGKGGGGGSSRELPFSGVNVIFTGDFGQLKPVGGYAVFSHDLLSKLSSPRQSCWRARRH
jgi:ATP-dependent DNA helicase PIF1